MASFSVSNLIIGATGPKISSLKTRMLVLMFERMVGCTKLSPKSQVSPPSSTLAPFIFISSMRLLRLPPRYCRLKDQSLSSLSDHPLSLVFRMQI